MTTGEINNGGERRYSEKKREEISESKLKEILNTFSKQDLIWLVLKMHKYSYKVLLTRAVEEKCQMYIDKYNDIAEKIQTDINNAEKALHELETNCDDEEECYEAALTRKQIEGLKERQKNFIKKGQMFSEYIN